MNNRTRYTLDEIKRNTYYQMPKFLFEGEFENLTNDARVLYSLLRDRHDLSIKNQWINENSEVYLIFSRENMCEMLKLSEKTITKAMNDLKKYKLIDEQRRGQGKPNLIYLLTIENVDITKNRKIYGSRTGVFTVQEQEFLRANDTEMNENKYNDNISSHPIPLFLAEEQKTDMIRYDEISNQSAENEKRQKNKESFHNAANQDKHLAKPSFTIEYNYNDIQKQIKTQIDYNNLLSDKIANEGTLDEIVSIISTTLCSNFKNGYISMGDEEIPINAVKDVFSKLTYEDIQFFVESYEKQTEPITKIVPYIRRSLYQNHFSIKHHYKNRTNVDMPELARKKRE